MNIIILRCVGVAVLLAGLVLVINPELVSRKPVPSDTFEAIERRIWWGLIIGRWPVAVISSSAAALVNYLCGRGFITDVWFAGRALNRYRSGRFGCQAVGQCRD